MRYPVILFDFDGVIADSLQTAFTLLNELAEEFGYVPLQNIQALREYKTQTLLKGMGVPLWQLPRLVTRARKQLANQIDSLAPFAQMPTVIEALASGRRLGILSSNNAENINAFWSRYALPTFDFIESDVSLFGKGRKLKNFLKKHHLSPEDVLYVGDETRDIDAAREAGIDIAAVCWGYHLPELLAAHAPDFLAHTPQDLLQYAQGQRF